MVDYKASGFGEFVKAKYYNATNAARCLGVSPLTILNNIKKPTGGYKVFGDTYKELLDTKQALEQARAMYADLAERYNKLIAGDNSSVEAYLKK